MLTDKVTSTPFVAIHTNGDFKSDVALGLQEWLHANGTISVDHVTDNFFCIKTAGDSFGFVETGSSDVDDSAAQHVAGFGGEDQGQMSSVCGKKIEVSVSFGIG
jgi:hypothetical protein